MKCWTDHDHTGIDELGVSSSGVWKLGNDRMSRVVLQTLLDALCNEGTHAALTYPAILRVQCAIPPVARDWRAIDISAASDRACAS